MQGSKQFKQALLKNLLLGLRKRGVASREMSFQERKNAIKHAADAALASARGGAPCWSRTLAAELAHRRTRSTHLLAKPPSERMPSASKMMCKKILRRSLRPRPRKATAAKAYGSAGVLARAMVRKRTRVLKEIVPGGKPLDECTLLGETLDYVRSLKAQVDVMQLLVRALQAPKPYAGEAVRRN